MISEQSDRAWDLVALGDSTPTGYGVGEDSSYVQFYAKHIEEDLGVDVSVHNWATNEIRRVIDWVKVVRNNDELRRDLLDAEVITLWMGWYDVILSFIIEREDSSRNLRRDIDVDRLHQVTSPMQSAFDKLLLEIVLLAEPEETLVLIAEVGIPSLFVERCKEYGILDQWKKYTYEPWRNYIIQAARKHQVHLVPTYEIINGPDGNQEMPCEYMQSDGVHFNREGHKLLAEAHRRVGYQYSAP